MPSTGFRMGPNKSDYYNEGLGLWKKLTPDKAFKLSDLEYSVLYARFEQSMTLAETGARLGFTREYARQVQKLAVEKLSSAE